jgi:hypothetical protein
MRQLIAQRLKSYLARECSVRELEAWLLVNLQTILDSKDRAAIDLANKVDADLMELSEGLLNEKEVRARARRYLREAEAELRTA